MSNFSPYIYQIITFPNVDLSNISKYYDNFTFLEKPTKRNAYKVSLAQMLNYMVDFGIGYNSVCVTVLTDAQEFNTGRYVNRHSSTSPNRPATVADLKTRINDIVATLISTVVNDSGLADNNTIFPTYFFTQDQNLTTLKVKQLTGHDYVEIEFDDFAYTGSIEYSIPQYDSGYVPIQVLRSCPNHSHTVNEGMKKSIFYQWKSGLHPQSHIMWTGHANQSHCTLFEKYNYDIWLRMKGVDAVEKFENSEEGASIECSPSWQKPASVSCYMNDPGTAINTVSIDGTSFVSIRYPGRRYRLFKRV